MKIIIILLKVRNNGIRYCYFKFIIWVVILDNKYNVIINVSLMFIKEKG